MSVCILDLNNFKIINDHYGHEVGDIVLKCVTQCLLETSRKKDVVARWGGDEILILLPAATENDTEILVKQIERKLKLASANIKINISVSIGTAVYPRDGQDLNQLIRHADRNMYQMKKNRKQCESR